MIESRHKAELTEYCNYNAAVPIEAIQIPMMAAWSCVLVRAVHLSKDGGLLVDIKQNQIVDQICAISDPLILVLVEPGLVWPLGIENTLKVLSVLDQFVSPVNALCRLHPELTHQNVGHIDSMNTRIIHLIDPFLDIAVHELV